MFEVIVSTLETKLQRIENLDKAVEHLMRRVEALDARLTYNIDKTDSIITKLRNLDTKLFQFAPKSADQRQAAAAAPLSHQLDERLGSLDHKVGDIDAKLARLKSQLDSNSVQPPDDINAEASEKKYVNAGPLDASKLLNAQLDAIRATTASLDKRLQFHAGSMHDSIASIRSMVADLHEAVVEPLTVQQQTLRAANGTTTTTFTPPVVVKSSKLDRLVRQMHPILSVSEKMDEVWDVVVGTKTSVDDLVPKSDELLTQTQRQERAINDIHADLRHNTDKIIANLDIVERRLKKQEDDVVTLAQRPVAAELLLDPTIDRLVEYDHNRYNAIADEAPSEPPTSSPTAFALPTVTVPTVSPPPAPATAGAQQQSPPTALAQQQQQPALANPNNGVGVQPGSAALKTSTARNRGLIFPSVKNKPSPTNTTFASDAYANIKDVKVGRLVRYTPGVLSDYVF